MESRDEHAKKLKEIADYAFSNGVKVVGLQQFEKPINSWSKEMFDTFFIACNDGFKIAQKMLIEEIEKYQSLLIENQKKIKEYRRLKDNDKIKKTEIELKIIEQRLHNFTHIADGIAWHLVGGNIHIARRLNIRDNSSKILKNSNIKHAISVAEKINENPRDFALISDITGYIQIGDLLAKHGNQIEIIELKEGKVNEQIKEFFEKAEREEIEITDDILDETFDQHTAKQAKRMQRQNERMENVTEIISNDKGTDPVSGMRMNIGSPQIPTVHYYDELIKLANELKEKIWAYTVVDECLHIGMYRDEGIAIAPIAIEETLKCETENYILIDWMSITDNLSEPIFAKPLPPEFIIDILIGKTKIIIGINLDAFIDLTNKYKLEARWLSTKETSKVKQLDKGKNIISMNNKTIGAKLSNGLDIILLTGGHLSKILYDNIKPTNIIETIISMEDYYRKITEENK